MSRLKQNQNIDNVIQGIMLITESQCSLSEQDKTVLDEALKRLHNLKRKKGKTNKQILKEVAKVVELIIQFFVCKTDQKSQNVKSKPNTP